MENFLSKVSAGPGSGKGLVTVVAPFLRQNVRSIAVIMLLQAAVAVTLLLLPSINAAVVDDGLLQGDIALTGKLAGVMVSVSVLNMFLVTGVSFLSARTGSSIAAGLRERVFSVVVQAEPHVVSRYRAGSLLTRVTSDAQQIQAAVQTSLTTIASAPIMIIGACVFSYFQQPQMLWLVIVAAMVLVVIVVGFAIATLPDSRLVQERTDRVTGILREQLAGFRPIRLFLKEREESERFGEANQALTAASWRLSRYMVGLPPVVFFLVNASTVAALLWGAGPVVDGTLGIGELLAFITYMVYVLSTAISAVLLVMLLPQAQVSAHRIEEILSEELSSTADTSAHNVHIKEFDRLLLRDVTCHLPGAEAAAVGNIDLEIHRGEFIAIVGSTGSGKTTLARIVAGLVAPSSGQVSHGSDFVPIMPRQLRKFVAFVPQEAYLFSGTVRSNITLGAPDAEDETLWSALEVAQAADLVREAGGLESPVSAGGANFSGGQRQRLSLARALVVARPVLVLDDTVAAVDATTERTLLGALRASGESRATVLVTQRMSAAASADRIVVLDRGRIVGLGTFTELLSNCIEFQQLQTSQSGATSL